MISCQRLFWYWSGGWVGGWVEIATIKTISASTSLSWNWAELGNILSIYTVCHGKPKTTFKVFRIIFRFIFPLFYRGVQKFHVTQKKLNQFLPPISKCINFLLFSDFFTYSDAKVHFFKKDIIMIIDNNYIIDNAPHWNWSVNS